MRFVNRSTEREVNYVSFCVSRLRFLLRLPPPDSSASTYGEVVKSVDNADDVDDIVTRIKKANIGKA